MASPFMSKLPEPSNLPRTSDFLPSQTALLLLDFHTLFVEIAGNPHGSQAVHNAAELRRWAISKGMTIVHALVDIHQDPPAATKMTTDVRAFIRSLRSRGGEEFHSLTVSPETTPAGEEYTFTRNPGLLSTLTSPGLMELLLERGTKSVILCGIATSGCVLGTVVGATDAGFVTTVVEDACADIDQEVYDFLIKRIFPNRTFVLTAEGVMKEHDAVVH